MGVMSMVHNDVLLKALLQVSPKKRMSAPTSLFGVIKQRTYRLLGYKHVRSINMGDGEYLYFCIILILLSLIMTVVRIMT